MIIEGATFYKTCFVVPDFVTEARTLTRLFGYEWIEVPPRPLEYRIGDDVRVLETRAIITRERPRIHLIEEIPGTPWLAGENGSAHHVAYWVDDIVAASQAMVNEGFAVECCDANDTLGPKAWAYFINEAGIRYELLGRFNAGAPETLIDDLPTYEV